MLLRVIIPTFLLAVAPISAHAAFFGPIVPTVCNVCPCGFGGVLQIIQNLMNFGISFAIIVATVIIAWGGFLYIFSSANPESRNTANKMLINAAVGLLIVLSAWLIVDFVMKSLYGGQFGPWHEILGVGGDECIQKNEAVQKLFDDGITTIPGGMVPGGSGANCPAANPAAMAAFPSEATSGGAEKATPGTVQNFMAMRAAAAKDKIDLKVTDGYRPESEQVSLWNQYCSSGTCGATKVAKPCSLGGSGSNHNSGQAIDIDVGCGNGNSSCNTKTYQWLKKNGSNWGFRNAIPSDPPHWSPSGS